MSSLEWTSFDLSEDEEANFLEPWENLIQHLKIQHLEDLKNFFKDDLDNFSDLKLNQKEFVYAIDNVLGNSEYSLQAVSLFEEIPYSEDEKLTWSQFLNYYIDHIITDTHEKIELPEPEMISVPHVKRETIIKIVSIETENSFCYAIVSKYGKVGLYTGDMKLLQTYQVIFTRCDKFLVDKKRKIKSIWITDAIFIPNVNIFVLSNSARNLIFYDASGQKHYPLWLIEGLPKAIYSMTCQCTETEDSKLFFGNDCGLITIMKFLQPKKGLLRKKYNDKLSHYYWRELKNENTYVQIKSKKIHSNLIATMTYYSETHSIVSCSRDKENSVVIFSLKESKKKYVFKTTQGVSSFSLNHKLHILLTGNYSGTIQFWNLYVPSKATATLQGHNTAIISTQVLACKNVAFTCCRQGVLKIWNLENYNCDQIIKLNYFYFKVSSKLITEENCIIYPGPNRFKNEDNSDSNENDIVDVWKRSPILISCCNFIAKININNNNNQILPPPALQNEILIPEDWKIEDREFDTIETGKMDFEIGEENKLSTHPILKNIIERDFLKNNPNLKHDINYKIAKLEMKKLEMMKPVSRCAPYLALDLYEIEEIKLSSNLPIPRCKKTQQISDKIQRLLSADGTRSEILSDRSSKSKSSRSSIVEF